MKKERKKKPKEIDIALFDHNTISNFWVKLLLYVKLRPSLSLPTIIPQESFPARNYIKNLQNLKYSYSQHFS